MKHKYTARLCFRNSDTRTLLIAQEFEGKTFRSVKSAVNFMEDRVKGMKCVTMQPRIDIYGQVWDGEKFEYGIALF